MASNFQIVSLNIAPSPIIGTSVALGSLTINASSSTVSSFTFNGNLSSSTPGNTLAGNVTTLSNFSIDQLRLIGNSTSMVATVVNDINSTQTTAQRSYIAAIAEAGFTKFSRLFTYIGRSNILYGYQTNQRFITGNITMNESNINSSYTSGNIATAGDIDIIETNYSILLNGTTQHGQLSNSLYYAYNTGTVEVWIRTSGAGSSFRGIIVKQFAYSLFLIDNILGSYDWGTGATRSTGITLNDDTWHHVALSFNLGVTNGSKIYIDGVLRLTTTISLNSQSEPLVIGTSGITSGQFFSGYISNVRIWDVILTDSYIANNYNRSLSPYTANLKGYWKFNENTGTTLNNLITNLGYNFTLINSPTWSSSAPIIYTKPTNPSAGTFNTGGAIVPTSACSSGFGIYAPNRDKIYCPAYSAGSPAKMFVIDCSTNTISTVSIPGSTNPLYRGAAFAYHNNKIFAIDNPNSTGTTVNCLVYNTNDDTSVTISVNNNSNSPAGYNHCAYDPINQSVYIQPRANTQCAVINTNTNTVSYISGFPGGQSFIGCVFSPPHRKIYLVPYGRSSVGIINTANNTFTLNGISASSGYIYGSLGRNGKIYMFPATRSNILVVDPSLNTATSVSTLNVGAGTILSGAVNPFDGKMYCIPSTNGRGNIIIIDTSLNTFSRTPITTTLTGDSTVIPTTGSRAGSIYGIPLFSTTGVIFSQYNQPPVTPGTPNTLTTISNIAYSVSIEDTNNNLSIAGNMIVSGNAIVGSLISSQTISSSSTIYGTFMNPTDSSNEGTIDQVSTELTLFGNGNKVSIATNNSLVFKNDNSVQLSAYTGRHKVDPVDIHSFITNRIILKQTLSLQNASNLILITVGSGGNIRSYNLGILKKGMVIRGVFFWVNVARASGSQVGIYRQSDVTLVASSQSNLAISAGFNYIPLSAAYTIPATDVYYVSTLIGGASGVNGLSLQTHNYYNYGFTATTGKLTANNQFTTATFSSLPSTFSGVVMSTSEYNVFIGIYG